MYRMRTTAMLGLALAAGIAFADAAKDLTKHMQAGMNRYCAAALRRDTVTMNKIISATFAPNCKIIGMDGKTMTLKEWKSMMDMQLKSMKSLTSMKITVGKVKVNGNKATGSETFSMTGTVPNMSDPKKTSKLAVMGTSASTYQLIKGKWMVTSSKDTSQKMTLDGKPFNPGGMK